METLQWREAEALQFLLDFKEPIVLDKKCLVYFSLNKMKSRLKYRWLSNIINRNGSVFYLSFASLEYFFYIHFNLISSLMGKKWLCFSFPKEEEKIVSVKYLFNAKPL